MNRIIEIRSYNLKAGRGAEFHAVVQELSGRSLHNPDSYCMIRSYANLEDLQQSQDAFYGSDEWKQGPREAIVSLVDSYTTVVLDVDQATIQSLRRPV